MKEPLSNVSAHVNEQNLWCCAAGSGPRAASYNITFHYELTENTAYLTLTGNPRGIQYMHFRNSDKHSRYSYFGKSYPFVSCKGIRNLCVRMVELSQHVSCHIHVDKVKTTGWQPWFLSAPISLSSVFMIQLNVYVCQLFNLVIWFEIIDTSFTNAKSVSKISE